QPSLSLPCNHPFAPTGTARLDAAQAAVMSGAGLSPPPDLPLAHWLTHAAAAWLTVWVVSPSQTDHCVNESTPLTPRNAVHATFTDSRLPTACSVRESAGQLEVGLTFDRPV